MRSISLLPEKAAGGKENRQLSSLPDEILLATINNELLLYIIKFTVM